MIKLLMKLPGMAKPGVAKNMHLLSNVRSYSDDCKLTLFWNNFYEKLDEIVAFFYLQL